MQGIHQSMSDDSGRSGKEPSNAASTCSTSTGSETPNNQSKLQHKPTRKEQIQKSVGFYVAIETAWHVGLFAACYRYRPLMRLSRTTTGKRVLDRLQHWTKGRQDAATAKANPVWRGLQNCVDYIPGRQRALVAASEWFFFNKVIGLPLWPTKLLLAGWLSQQFEKYKHEFGMGNLINSDSSNTNHKMAEQRKHQQQEQQQQRSDANA